LPTPCSNVVVEIVGEGKTDLGTVAPPSPPNKGVVPILVHSLCGRPQGMLVKRLPFALLQSKSKGLAKKVQFAKRQASCNGSDGVVFVIDSDGDLAGRMSELVEGRDRELPDYPMAIGVAHPCIESWLLADPAAIRRALELGTTPQLADDPEQLPAPLNNRKHNPKTVLRDISGVETKEVRGKEKDAIAAAMNDMSLVRKRCPQSFAPFADEVENRIRPLF
jgi:hypothetical protein